MEQLELELGLQPVKKWPHVWEEKSRQALRGKNRIAPVGEEAKNKNIKNISVCEASRQTLQGKRTSDTCAKASECHSSSSQKRRGA